ncbi:AraC family transcriptional regulator [Rhodococcus hoagii]|nr:AraC family transcriptional regulator [Prescottella equi]
MSTAQEIAEKEHISDLKKYLAEGVGTFVLVFAAIGTAVFSGSTVGQIGIALAFGLTLMFLVYAIGPIRGATSILPSRWDYILGRVTAARAGFYVLSQVVGGLVAGLAVYAIAQSVPSYNRREDGLAANGWGVHSPSAQTGPLGKLVEPGYGIGAAMTVEIVLTALLVFVVLASTDQLSDVPLAGVSIGFTLAVIHLISIPIDNTSVNPARSFAVAAYQPGAMGQVWLFIVFPLIGGALGAVIYRALFGRYNRLND